MKYDSLNKNSKESHWLFTNNYLTMFVTTNKKLVFIKFDSINKNSNKSNSLFTKTNYLTIFITTIRQLCL